MKNTDVENQISCLVESGIVYSKRDMIRILRDLDYVEYIDLVDNIIVAQGQGYVIEVYANSFDSTLVFNNRLHINVNGFDFLKLRSNPKKEVELISGHRIIKLTPLTNILKAMDKFSARASLFLAQCSGNRDDPGQWSAIPLPKKRLAYFGTARILRGGPCKLHTAPNLCHGLQFF